MLPQDFKKLPNFSYQELINHYKTKGFSNSDAEKEIEKIGKLRVSDYKEPGQMTSALDATYLISEEIKSPMGANLSAFESAQIANTTKDESGGELYTWIQLLNKFDAE